MYDRPKADSGPYPARCRRRRFRYRRQPGGCWGRRRRQRRRAVNPRCNWPSALTVDAALLGAGVSIGAGILFGLWPACQAAGVNPIEALRFE